MPLVIVINSDGQKYLKANVKPDQIAPWLQEFKVGTSPLSQEGLNKEV